MLKEFAKDDENQSDVKEHDKIYFIPFEVHRLNRAVGFRNKAN